MDATIEWKPKTPKQEEWVGRWLEGGGENIQRRQVASDPERKQQEAELE